MPLFQKDPERPVRRRGWRAHARIILRSHGTPEQVALGAVIGVFVGLTPLLGIHLPTALLLAWMLRASRLATLPGVFVTNVFTAIPIYTFTYKLGNHLLPDIPELDIRPVLREVLHSVQQHDWYAFREIVKTLAQISSDSLAAMFIGGFIVAALVSVPVWFATLRIVRHWRERRTRRLRIRGLEWFKKHVPHRRIPGDEHMTREPGTPDAAEDSTGSRDRNAG